jgi:hypothetical protein
MKPVQLSSLKTNPNQQLTSAEMGKLWATYIGNTMSECIISYFLQHVDDEDIKTLLENALTITKDFKKKIEDIFNKDQFPVPIGFTLKDDVNLGAPRLFEDEFYVHYLKYVLKSGLSIYSVAMPLVFRKDVSDFFQYSVNTTLPLLDQIKDILMSKGFIIKPPIIPLPEKAEFIKQDFLNGYIGHVRPLHAMEIAHLYDNIENNATSKALIMGFSQIAKDENIRQLFLKGKEITHKAIERYMEKLYQENLPSPSFIDHLVTTSTVSPFSDKLMLFHKVDMFSMKIRSFGNAVSVSGRHDLSFMYTRSLMNISLFVEDAAKQLIENGWMEKPPEAADRNQLSSN